MEELCRALEARWGSFLVLDLHSYNHRRDGPHRPPAPSAANPEINIGTGRLDRGRWGSVVGCFLDKLRGHDHLGRRLDARENVRFRGGHFSRWVNERFDACCLAIEVKKFFMDEWTGVPDRRELRAVRDALGAAAGGALEALSRAGRA